MKKKNIKIVNYIFMALLFLNLIAIMSCSDNNDKIKSMADSGMGYWLKKSDVEYEYRISNINKEKIFKEEMKLSEKTRNSKILLGIQYIFDIDSTFLSMDNTGFNIDLASKDTLIQGRDKDYLIVFEGYKNIYFPKSISVKNK